MDAMMQARARRRRRTSGGFTLIEVTIAMGILAFGLLALTTMQIKAMHGGNRGRHASNAAAIAENKMEQLQQNPWASIPDTGGFVADPASQNAVALESGSSNERTYNVSYQITDIEATFTRAIDVTVRWTEEGGENRSITLSSIRYNREGT